jgi:8-oxo-dGTP pyrophosphatase MutT (NUDIX family)
MLESEIENFLNQKSQQSDPKMIQRFRHRLQGGNLTRDSNAHSHFCVYFAAYDIDEEEFFIGHHIKSDLWLFNGGHIELNESLEDTVKREMKEEWGRECSLTIPQPQKISFTKIESQPKMCCKEHYNFWYFIEVDKVNFHPKQECLAHEFHEALWVNKHEALSLVTDFETRQTIIQLSESITKKQTLLLQKT